MKIAKEEILKVIAGEIDSIKAYYPDIMGGEWEDEHFFQTMESPVTVLQKFLQNLADNKIDLFNHCTYEDRELTQAEKDKINHIHHTYKVFYYSNYYDRLDMYIFDEHNKVIQIDCLNHEDVENGTGILLNIKDNLFKGDIAELINDMFDDFTADMKDLELGKYAK